MPPETGPPKPITYRYRIAFGDGVERAFAVDIHAESLGLLRQDRASYPEWTRLGFHRCPNCPLEESRHPRCPVAESVAELVDAFGDFPSYEQVDVVVESKNRTYSRHTSLQTAVSSLLGLYMVTSGCPILNQLRPMVDMHLPFMNREETLYRMLTMYLLAQYFREKNGQPADWDLEGLTRLLGEIRKVNVAFCERLNAIEIKDASVNAVVILSTLGDFPNRLITKRDLARLERIFREHGPQ
jgi:hypothetical protein